MCSCHLQEASWIITQLEGIKPDFLDKLAWFIIELSAPFYLLMACLGIRKILILTLKNELYEPIFQCMHCKPTPGNTLKNKNKLINFECTLRVRKQWEQMHYLIIKKPHSIQCKAEEGAQAPRSTWSKSWFEELLQPELELSVCSERWGGGEYGQLLMRTSCHFLRNSETVLLEKKSLLLSNMRSNTIKNSVVHTFLQLHDKLLILFNAALLATTSLLQSSAFLLRVRSISYLSDTGSALITLTQS